VPEKLRAVVGKTELRAPLGGDYRQALKLLPGAVAQLQHQIALAEDRAGQGNPSAPRYPLKPDQIAMSHYMQRLAFDDELRNEQRWPAIGVDDVLVARLRAAVAGRANDNELVDLVGEQLERFRAAGNLDASQGSDEWRIAARALCSAELEALARVAERDEGDFSGQPTTPLLVDALPPQDEPDPVKLSKLWRDYAQSRMQAGFMRDRGSRQEPVIKNLRKFLRHDDARRVTKKDLLAWRDQLLTTLSARTVSDVYLSTVRTLFRWAVQNEMLPENVAETVRQPKPRRQYSREKGYTLAEAAKVLKASISYQPHADENGYIREKSHLVSAKRWVPIICAFTGARVTEITQLRKEDVWEVDGCWIIRLTPEAGSLKAGSFRDIPLHTQIIDLGFPEFVQAASPGPLFHGGTEPEKYASKAERISNQLSEWLRRAGLVPDGVQPNHGWRHRFKTQCRELGVSSHIADAIQGHSGKTASDNYGDVTLAAKRSAIICLPHYDII
jgi:integrase